MSGATRRCTAFAVPSQRMSTLPLPLETTVAFDRDAVPPSKLPMMTLFDPEGIDLPAPLPRRTLLSPLPRAVPLRAPTHTFPLPVAFRAASLPTAVLLAWAPFERVARAKGPKATWPPPVVAPIPGADEAAVGGGAQVAALAALRRADVAEHVLPIVVSLARDRTEEEHRVLAPLMDVALSKSEIRALSRAAGLPTADLPASACLGPRMSLVQDRAQHFVEVAVPQYALGCHHRSARRRDLYGSADESAEVGRDARSR